VDLIHDTAFMSAAVDSFETGLLKATLSIGDFHFSRDNYIVAKWISSAAYPGIQ